MTESEAIKNVTAYVYMECENMPKQVIQALDIMKDATKKQIPKKPIINYINTSEDVTEIEYTCSVCGTNFVELTPCKEWCPYCGNKIDWSDGE